MEAMATAAAERDSAAADPLIDATLYACSTVDEWLQALERYPAAMGATDKAELGELDVKVACYQKHEAPVCKDAVLRGIDLP